MNVAKKLCVLYIVCHQTPGVGDDKKPCVSLIFLPTILVESLGFLLVSWLYHSDLYFILETAYYHKSVVRKMMSKNSQLFHP